MYIQTTTYIIATLKINLFDNTIIFYAEDTMQDKVYKRVFIWVQYGEIQPSSKK